MYKTRTAAQRHNSRMDKIFDGYKGHAVSAAKDKATKLAQGYGYEVGVIDERQYGFDLYINPTSGTVNGADFAAIGHIYLELSGEVVVNVSTHGDGFRLTVEL